MYHQDRANRGNPIFLYDPSRSGKTTILKVIEDDLYKIKGVKVLKGNCLKPFSTKNSQN